MDADTKEREADPLAPCNRCRDFDEDCEKVSDKLHCWLYAPEQGWCPYLLATKPPAL
jgi:hypothetical protein